MKALLVSLVACGVEQSLLESCALETRKSVAALPVETKLFLFIDTYRGLADPAGLAEKFDGFFFHRERTGVGAARTAVLNEARLREADYLVLADGDGQYGPAALAQMAAEIITDKSDVICPQRADRHLPLGDNSCLNRLLAEDFQNYALATSIGRPEYCWSDLQPGAFALNAAAVDAVLPLLNNRDFSWDLAFSRHVLASDLKVGFLPVGTNLQTTTLYGGPDFTDVMRWLFSSFGREKVLALVDGFAAEPRVAGGFSSQALTELTALLKET